MPSTPARPLPDLFRERFTWMRFSSITGPCCLSRTIVVCITLRKAASLIVYTKTSFKAPKLKSPTRGKKRTTENFLNIPVIGSMAKQGHNNSENTKRACRASGGKSRTKSYSSGGLRGGLTLSDNCNVDKASVWAEPHVTLTMCFPTKACTSLGRAIALTVPSPN
ncbi:hypothetical protein GQX74_007088 [Glossina fuscipes]|nr:hypothetical protein GQX74_007088 [Glossina fuscipes]